MSAPKRKCCCLSRFCRSVGGTGELRFPKDRRSEFEDALGLDVSGLADPRLWSGHFPQEDFYVRVGRTGLELKLTGNALPNQTEAQMAEEYANATGQLRRSVAVGEYHRLESVSARKEGKEEREVQEKIIEELESKVRRLEGELAECKRRRSAAEEPPARCVVDETILGGLADEVSRSLCGLRNAESLNNLLNFLDAEGAVANMNFYNADSEQASGIHADGSRVIRRKKKLGGATGLFFTLFVLRTGMSLRVASTLFGVSEATGGRAFTTWLDFFASSVRPVVRLPDVEDVVESAPPNFRRSSLSSVALVFDATEYRVDKVWQTEAQRAIWSQYKQTYTGKVLVCITPAGAISFVSPAYVGRTSDVQLVKQCGIIEELAEQGFGGKGMHIMGDRGFNSIAPLLLNIGMHYVAPPSTRVGEEQFTEEDAALTREVANLRIHVERAIGAMRQWRILDTKFDSQQMDQIGKVALVCAALVNLTRKPFASVD